MDIKTPTQELLALLQGNYGTENTKEIDPKKLKYVLYARKSTTDDERQERSIPDQIQDCLKSCVTPKGLNVVKIVEEKYSAKEPDTRTEFSKMINDIKAGRYDGIIAWHPDRLSRNMKEAGEIIDLLDKGILKDLQFATLTFENNPTGKMLLGISFVLSKQYSEHLSESVARGNKHITEKGEYIGQLKHGYMITKDRKLYPDGQNFTIIKQAFEKRIAGERQLDIAKWLNKTGYMVRRWQKDPEPFVWDKDAVHKLLKDPVYAGVLKYGRNLVDLMPLYDFQQAISVEDFLKINKTSSLSSTKLVSSMVVKSKETTRANYLRGIVYCGHCHKAFSSGITTKKLKDGSTDERYYYRCETLTCPFRNKSVPSTQVTWYVYNYLKDHRFTTQENYDYWIGKAKEQLKQTLKQMESRITSLSKTIALKEDEYEETKKLIRVNPVLQEHYDLKAIKKEIKTYKDEQSKLVIDRKEAKSALPTYEKYLELINGVSEILMDEEEGEVKDSVVRVFFSNFTVTADNFTMKRGYDITHKLNEPWEGFVKSEKFDRGRGERTRTFDLTVPNRAR
jgi:DNA invertase Pin-like site-specific DNA recombinase